MKLYYRLSRYVMLGVSRVLWDFRRYGTDFIPSEGPVIIAGNHISNWDPILLGMGCPREVHFMAKNELFKNRLLGWFVTQFNAMPVRRGEMDRGALRAAGKILTDGDVLLMFPGGRRDRTGGVNDPKAGVGFIACMNEAPVVPAYISGSTVLTRALIRKASVAVTFGPALQATKANSSDEYRAFSRKVVDAIERLKAEVEAR